MLADGLLAEGLIACANILPGAESRFVWQGEVHASSEAILVLKTTCSRLDDAIARLTALHPYDTPAVSGWLADASAQVTLDWLSAIGKTA
ncbi:Divalent-cation tolerance protein CutA [Paraurantiacibacter namhicola]|uniref:Divalent-cation tolerance protein CutA n=1 Tax=Paraurantiacibacter namhicola TaxID=645517 RepID=A0A1C7D5P3_9SPHN|nr:Divalent-cation tolerance protein CutA [Paraurantiacibacter namhicola]